MCAVKAHLTFLYLPHILVEFPWQAFADANYQLFSDFHRCTILENPQLRELLGEFPYVSLLPLPLLHERYSSL